MPIDRKHEAAAFLAQIAARDRVADAVRGDVQAHHAALSTGAGAIQITGLANYQAAEAAGFAGIVANPARVLPTPTTLSARRCGSG